MRKIVLDTNCLLMSLPRISPYRKIWDDFLKGKLTLCVTNEIIEEYLEIIEQKTNANIASNVVSVILSQKNVEFVTPYYKLHLIQADEDDNKFVDCAFSAGASCIVSNDAHFKILNEVEFPRIFVVNIKNFVELLLRNQGNIILINRNCLIQCKFSKIIPSFFTIKEGSTFLTKPLFPQEREDVTALWCSEPLRSKVSGPSKVFAMLCGMGPPCYRWGLS